MAKKLVQPSNVPAGTKRPYSLGLSQGNYVFVSGQVGADLSTGKPASETDFDAQVRQAIENVKAILEAAGSSLDKVVLTNCWLTDINNWQRMNEIYMSYFPEPRPTRATVQSGLIPPYMFEIQAIGYIGD